MPLRLKYTPTKFGDFTLRFAPSMNKSMKMDIFDVVIPKMDAGGLPPGTSM